MSEFPLEIDFEIEGFRDVMRSHLLYHGPCYVLNWCINEGDDGVWNIEVAAPFQVIYGGADDGKKVWPPFEFDILGFLNEPDIDDVSVVGAMTFSKQDNTLPFIGIVGNYRGSRFFLSIYLEPDPASKPLEILDTLNDIVRPITEEQT